MSKGEEYTDLFFEHKISNVLGLEDGKVSRSYSGIDFGMGARVLKGGQIGFAFTENISLKEMAKTVGHVQSNYFILS